MFLIIKNNDIIDVNNISLVKHDIYNFYNLYYNFKYIKLTGIPISINIDNIVKKNNRFNIYFNDNNENNIIYKLNNYFIEYIKNNNFIFIRTDRESKKKYIIGNYRTHISNNNLHNIYNTEKNNISIIIYKIKNIKGIYIPIINIL